MPYKNVMTPFTALYPRGFNGSEVEQTEPVVGLRLQWGSGDDFVTVVTCPMPDGMPEQSFLESSKAQRAYLDRPRINELIKCLREARDGAFGKDQ